MPSDERSIADPQQVAWDHRCHLGGETGHPRFRSVLPGRRWSLVLSINTGYE